MHPGRSVRPGRLRGQRTGAWKRLIDLPIIRMVYPASATQPAAPLMRSTAVVIEDERAGRGQSMRLDHRRCRPVPNVDVALPALWALTRRTAGCIDIVSWIAGASMYEK